MPIDASTSAMPEKRLSSSIDSRRWPTDWAISSSMVRAFAMGWSGSTDCTARRAGLTYALGSPAVRTATVRDGMPPLAVGQVELHPVLRVEPFVLGVPHDADDLDPLPARSCR